MSERDGRPALKPCPFCGGASRVYCNDNGNNEWIARCRNLLTCGHRGSAWLTEAEAINSWNRRAALAAPVAAPPVPSVPYAPLLVGDLAADIGVGPLIVCKALETLGYGPHSVNMAVTADMARQITAHFAATAQPAPAAVPADLHAYMLQVLKRERAALDGFIALGNEAPRAAKFDRWIAALLAAAPQQAPTGGAE